MIWDALGSLADLLGAVGVIISFFYLSKQFRIALKTVCTQSYRDVINDFQNTWSALQSPDTTKVVRIAVND